MKRACIAAMILFVTHSSVDSIGQPETEDMKLEKHFKQYLDAEFKLHPLYATHTGNHDHDDRLDDLSPQARKASIERTRKTLADLPRLIAYKKLTRPAQIDFEIWQHELKKQIWLAENTDRFANDPRVYSDYITGSVYALLTQSTLPQPVNVRNAIARMSQIPKIVAAAKVGIKNPPKVLTEVALKQNRGAIAFYEKGIFDLAGADAKNADLRDAAKRLVVVLKDYQKFLENDVLPRSTGDWRIGKKRFGEKMPLVLDAGVSADEVLKEAEDEATRVENEMYVIARQLWSQVFPKRTIPVDDANGRRETIRLVLDATSKEHGKADDLIKDARAGVERIKAFIKEKDILRLPNPDRCQIIEMPEFQRGFSIAYLNPAPPLDAKASSYYAISPPPGSWDARRVKSFMEEYNRHILQILTIHEAYPGHYVQLEYANRHPSLIRKILFSGVFAEGWAVYTEQVMLDEGYGKGDLKLRLHQLKWYMRTVCNAILDYKMHCTNITDEEAIRFLILRAFQSEAEAILKVLRAKQSSCQLSTYFVGRMAFQRLRRRLQRELGEKFELGRFHEAALAHGSLPVKYLPEVTRARLKLRR
ncbi:MAG: DUF885 domain-containing protein [Planctomycetes bacterium]|nr:DUF885 domain-containing protein [Planctomycetota bacterium]